MTRIRASITAMMSGLLLGLAAAMPAAAAPGDPVVPSRAPEPPEADQPAGAPFDYLFIAGSTFHPVDSTTAYTYTGGGCIAKTGGFSMIFAHKAVLPQGAVVRFLRIYYRDTSESHISAYFTSYNALGTGADHANVSSTNASGTALSPEFNYEVNQAAAPINVIAHLREPGTGALEFCGARIAYEPPPLPDLIFRDGFEP